MPSAAYMGMMMMMVVFPSEHAKQQLSLLLPPKVFFHLSFTPFHPAILLLLSCEHCVASSYPSVSRFISTYLFIFYFSSHNVLSPPLPLSLWLYPPLSLDPSWHWYCSRVVWYDLSSIMWWRAVRGVVNTSVGVHPFGSYCFSYLTMWPFPLFSCNW